MKHLKKGRQTYDEVISDLIEDREYASPEFRKEHFRRLRKEKGSPWEEVVRRLKL